MERLGVEEFRVVVRGIQVAPIEIIGDGLDLGFRVLSVRISRHRAQAQSRQSDVDCEELHDEGVFREFELVVPFINIP